jgi:hypothetical protein
VNEHVTKNELASVLFPINVVIEYCVANRIKYYIHTTNC